MDPRYYVEIYQRKDGKWSWRLRSGLNGKIVASDAAQGYSRRIDTVEIARSIFPDYGQKLIERQP